ncbi:efflux RND transporter periplasmic adaptor subunit [Flavobacterium sp. NRK F10]|uniref:efflux RND transporter periplasmic adaptor subunit n=1 Tax=Flavobacterium sp. NRK F10 TaxID=2954931 RepID=UPI00209036E9|nr:efflux RND transporter periplasmic adaptor subunit [Flavobacterium sp. NRK F10]MCO6174579.1 efflux RND transporter periplasmic adaptor subunit [Flavobacterium sp. NRK F10]
MNNKKIKWIALTGVTVIVLTLAYFLFSGNKESEIKAETVKAKKANVVSAVTATGTIEPITQVEVGTQVSGVVEKIYVDYNSEVKEGQLIAELDKTNLQAALVQAKASYDSALNEQNYLETIYKRQKTLFENNVISKSDYDEARYNYNNAKSAAIQKLSELQKAQTNLSYANIYSPIDGVVLSRDVDEGQTVAASYSTPTLFTIAKDLKEMQVEADVDEADIGQVKEGQRVTFTVDAYQDEEFSGKITQVRLNPTTTSNVVTYTVVIKAENPELKLKPGLTATISIYTLELQDVLTVEAKAVNFIPNEAYLEQFNGQSETVTGKRLKQSVADYENQTTLWVLENNQIVSRNVKLGASDGVNVQVLNNLLEGEDVVYGLKEVSGQEANTESSSAESPFMPKPPGKKK